MEATTALSDVVDTTSAPPTMRIQAARYVAGILSMGSMIEYALPILEKAVELLPSIAPRSLTRVDQQRRLSAFNGFASDAAALSLDFGETPMNVVRLFDSGRCILQGHILDIRTDTRGLPRDLALEYESLKTLLDPPFEERERFNMDSESHKQVDARHRASLDLERLVEKIRQYDGFADFGLPLSQQAVLQQAKQGPIVILNVNKRRSDALIVTEFDVLCEPLSKLNVANVQLQVENFRKAIDTLTSSNKGTGKKKSQSLHTEPVIDPLSHEREIFSVLEWLWDAIVEPVLSRLGYSKRADNDSNLPNVWWCSTGLLSFLPIHAAGYYNGSSSQSAMDCVISAYTS